LAHRRSTVSDGLGWGMVALGLLVVVTRRRTTAIALVALQTLLLGVYALSLTPGRSTEFLVASVVLLARTLPLCVLLAFSVRRTREPRPLRSRMKPLLRVGLVVAAVFVVLILAPSFGLATRAAEQASVGMLTIGVATIVARRSTIFHLLGLIIAENGIALAAVAVPGGLPLLIELGVAFDLVVVITVATAFHQRIFGEFGTGDTAVLRDLRD
jgi:hydrogenase-4 component E